MTAVVMQASGADGDIVLRAWRHAGNLLRELPDARIEIVVQGAAVTGLVSGTETAAVLRRLRGDAPNVAVLACRNALRAHDVDLSTLADGIGSVPAGIAHIVTRQAEGWAYVVTA